MRFLSTEFFFLLPILFLVLFSSACAFLNHTDGSILHGIVLPQDPSVPEPNCEFRSEDGKRKKSVKFHLLHRDQRPGSAASRGFRRIESLLESNYRDVSRILTFHDRIDAERPKSYGTRDSASHVKPAHRHKRDGQRARFLAESEYVPGRGAGKPEPSRPRVVATLESGVSVESGEYLMDVYIGTPPRHFSLIVDTGSDLNWVQCLPCNDCFEQVGPPYDPAQSSSFRPVSCKDSACQHVSSPDTTQPRCKSDNGTCEYFYWYGDRSNTTGDLATETFTVNVSSAPAGPASAFRLENIVFGCGHWNRGLFHGAGGLLGFGRGALSFLSQLQSTYGRKFSYCLVDRDSDASVSGRLVFGEDDGLARHPNLQFTELVAAKDSPVDTFYYVRVRAVRVGGEVLRIPPETFQIGADGSGGTIVDSGTTLTYFPEPAMAEIKGAFMRKVKGMDRVMGFKLLDPCFNATGVDRIELPEFSILFSDGAVWSFPAENYFIRLQPEGIICLALLGTPMSSLSILGNYQQQNFHVLYDLEESRLGFAPTKCAEV